MKIIYLLILQNILSAPLFAGKEAAKLAEDEQHTKKIISFICSLRNGPSHLLRYQDPTTKAITPIFTSKDHTYKLVKRPAPIDTYRAISQKRTSEAYQRIYQIMTMASVGTAGLIVARFYPKYHQLLVKNVLSQPMVWGVTMPSALFVDLERFNPFTKFKQAKIIDQFTDPSAKPTVNCEDPVKYIKAFKEALGIDPLYSTLEEDSNN